MKMNLRFQAIVLMALGLFLYTRVSSGTVLFYISQRFTVLTLFTAFGLMILGISYYYRAAPDSEVIEAGFDRPPNPVSWLGLIVVSLPIILGLLVPPAPLGASAIGNREINLGTLNVAAANNVAVSMIPSTEKNILDWLGDFQRTPDPATFDGQEAHIVGFVYRDERFEPGTFMVGRFIVSCCVADAAPVGLVVEWPEAASLVDDQWIEVRGRLQAGEFNGRDMPILIAEMITPTEAPPQPYLYY